MTLENELIEIKRNDGAKLPIKSGAGYILLTSEKTILKAGEKKLVPSGLSMRIPKGYYGQLYNLDENIGKLKLFGGVIDSDYRGNISGIIKNISNEEVVMDGPMCLIVFVKICAEQIIEVERLGESARGASGFGSTGK